jgi:hypothetical protein
MCLDIQVVLSQFRLQFDVGQMLASPRPQQPREAVLVGKFDNARVDRGTFYFAAGGKIEQEWREPPGYPLGTGRRLRSGCH